MEKKLDREQVKKALECCTNADEVCDECILLEDGNCCVHLLKNALSLINELTEENERLRVPTYMLREDGGVELMPTIKSIRADTVRKMQEMLQAYFGTYVLGYKIPLTEALKAVNQIAKKMLEGER